ncbi:MAG: tetratricopeptide repeat protein [Bacteroidaceae bacterium]|nr:tetratricopeptide repeat protein [Bacteroidaceae bacterium]
MEISENVVSFIENDNIASAIELLKQRVTLLGNWDIQNDMEKIEFSYNTMLDYMLQNYVDENAMDERNKTKLQILAINDLIDRAERYKERPADLYCLAMRNHGEMMLEDIIGDLVTTNIDLQTVTDDKETRDSIRQRKISALRTKIEELRLNMFENVWSSGQWNNSRYETSNTIIDSQNIDDDTKAIFVSAVTLSILEYFDIKKLQFLFDAYYSSSNAVSMRGIVGVVLALRLYDKRIRLSKELTSKLKILSDDTVFIKDIIFVCTQLQLSGATDAITAKMNTDILPSIMAGRSFKEAMGGIKKKGNDDENPEWEKTYADMKAEKKIHEMAEMELDGADIYLSSFRLMKSFDFFHKIPHWFYPFDPKSPLISNSDEGNDSTSIADAIINSTPFCNSDLYSFAISMSSISSMTISNLSDNLKSQMSEDEMDAIISKVKDKANISAHRLCRYYIFDLYRFYFLFPHHSQFYNPFRHSISGNSKEYSFMPMDMGWSKFDVSNIDTYYKEMGNVLLRNGLYHYALKAFQAIDIEETEENAGLFQKLAFCLEKEGLDCIDCYRKAYSLNSTSHWTLNHLVAVLMAKEEYDECIGYYKELLAMQPENTNHLLGISKCLCHTGRHEEALEYMYKLQYIAPETSGIGNILVECLLGTGNLDKLCEQVIGSENTQDILIGAFVFITEENYIGAHELFKMAWEQWAKDTSKNKLSFSSEFNSAYDLCKKHMALNDTIVRMLYDATMLR